MKSEKIADQLNNSNKTNSSKETIKEKDRVEIIGSNNIGMVFSIGNIGDIKKYEVFVNGEIKTYFEGQIKLLENKINYNWVDIEKLHCYLSAYTINNPSSANLYSLNSARIDFVPYQFRPALKLIKSDEPRILIADSVGVGKTIEAGLIIKELSARKELTNIMIICPKPLVADRKWENEMKRFDEEFLPVDSITLERIISNCNRDGEWSTTFYSKIIVPYSILDHDIYYGKEGKYGKKGFGLLDLNPAPHFDLIIIDEAHHLRNGSLEKEKAYAYKCVKYFCDHSDAVVMLTATPLQNSNNDLYTLLNLLRPDLIIDKNTFETMSRPNPFISQCSHIVRQAKDDWQGEALETLNNILVTQWGENVISRNPKFNQIKTILQKQTVTREERVKLITDIESLHSFNLMINRTRRKDIQDFCIRRTFTLESDFTNLQKKIHDSILEFEISSLAKLHNGRGIKFMTSMIRRQAASCVFGLVGHLSAILNRRMNQLLIDNPDIDFDEEDLDKVDISYFKDLASNILKMTESLPDDDPKFDSILKIINEKQQMNNNKIIIFSCFRYTLDYIYKKLLQIGIHTEQINGSIDNEERLELRRRFELPKEDKDSIDILLFTEVGSEGLDYQFCDTIINYDLPWNPMRIEQRIGRIDRRGQKSEYVNIYNVITSETVDADIYKRCLSRIGVFENSIGECEEILGEIGRQIESIALNSKLTEEERRAKLEQMADNEVRKAQELTKLENEEKELFGFDLSNFTLSKEIKEAENIYLSPDSLLHLVKNYLNERLGNGNYFLGDAKVKKIRLNSDARSVLLEDLRKLPKVYNELRQKWELYLKQQSESIHDLTFEPDIAEKNRNAFFITPLHPLVKQAANYYANNSLVYTHLEYFSKDMESGVYPFEIYTWNYTGDRPSFKIITICENTKIEEIISEHITSSNTLNNNIDINNFNWDELEKIHLEKWQVAKEKHIKQTEQSANYKIESIKSNHYNKKNSLERLLANIEEPNIRKMRYNELINSENRYNQKIKEINDSIKSADIHTTLIVKGIISIRPIKDQI